MKNQIVDRILFKECKNWVLETELHHITNRYFSIVCVKKRKEEKILIRQEEIGILGLVHCHENGTGYFLCQDKSEPGNYPYSQLAPTVQATLSNYERVHQGQATNYLDFFLSLQADDVIASEQGDRFFNKFNRNTIFLADKKFEPVNRFYRWLSLADLKRNLLKDYTVNTDLRSVIATGNWEIFTYNKEHIFLNMPNFKDAQSFHHSYFSVDEQHLTFAKDHKERYYCRSKDEMKLIPLSSASNICIESDGIYQQGKRIIEYFDVHLPNREVQRWQQPLFCKESLTICKLYYKVEKNQALFYLKLYNEIGYINRAEYGPSVQYDTNLSDKFHKNLPTNSVTETILVSVKQTDEGGRFYQNKCQYEICEITEYNNNNSMDSSQGIWVTLGELSKLCKIKGMTTNELRTCVSLIVALA